MKAKTIYISLPISGHEDTYEQRLGEAVECVKKKFPDAEIITPKVIEAEVKAQLEHVDPTCGQYLGADIACIIDRCDAVVFWQGWASSKGCGVEYAAAVGFDKDMFYWSEGDIALFDIKAFTEAFTEAVM